ncbi:PREDICTED: uncharacterized protein LOC109157464 [Ipomoea nil]|uniref:uncharacterized protein LOC109157464 n=1 Tax=Ipomoea nil TaxID=35883 RepID=UPI0009008B4E|nr:PREDICTED: uncharacterized protein LOC109157464 [Ipomoea nil]
MEAAHGFFAIVYASPDQRLRRRLWDDLQETKRGILGPWMVAGDFNAVTSQAETLKYTAYNAQRSVEFVNWIHAEGLIDMGFSGPKLTWVKGPEGIFTKGARLDHAMCDLNWRQRFGEATFKFQAAWLTHNAFLEEVRRSWSGTCDLTRNIQEIQGDLKTWNKEVFDCIEAKKRILLARIEGIQRRVNGNYHSGLSDLEKKLRSKLEEVLYQEELMWYQRSREELIVSGDRNTKFYHAATMVRKSRNRILSLKDDTGNWITDTEAL